MKARGEENEKGNEVICDKIRIGPMVFYAQVSALILLKHDMGAILNDGKALMRTFIISDSRSKGEAATPPVTRVWGTAFGPSSAERGRFSPAAVDVWLGNRCTKTREEVISVSCQ